jgi:hypothetical protein
MGDEGWAAAVNGSESIRNDKKQWRCDYTGTVLIVCDAGLEIGVRSLRR